MDDGGRVTRQVLIEGRVQGVGYRDWLVARAREAGLSGWVRNRRDGRVEALISGLPGAVEAMLSACGQGPLHARVAAVNHHEAEPPDTPAFERRPSL